LGLTSITADRSPQRGRRGHALGAMEWRRSRRCRLTQKSEGKARKEYTKYLQPTMLKRRSIGIARDFLGQDPEATGSSKRSLAAMRRGRDGARPRYPKWLLETKTEFYKRHRARNRGEDQNDYLATLKDRLSRTHRN